MNENIGDEDGFAAAVSEKVRTLGFAFSIGKVKVPEENTFALELNLFRVPPEVSRATNNTALDWVMELEEKFGIYYTFVHVHCDDLDPVTEASIMELSAVKWRPGEVPGQPLTK